MLNSFFNFLIKKPTWSLVLLLIVIVTTLSQIQYFSLDASSDSLSLEGDDNLELYFETLETFGSDESLIISYTAKENIINANQLEHLRSFRDSLLEIEEVNSVISILDVSLFKSPPLSLVELAGDLFTIDNGKADMSFIESEFQSSPIYANNLISKDLRTTALLIPLNITDPTAIVDGEILKSTITKIRSTMDEYRNDVTLFLGGVPMIRNDVITYITNDLIVFSLAVVLIMSIILAIIFRSIRWVLMPITISVTGALFMTGLIGAIGWKVTVISANFFSLLLVMTLSVTIHLVVRYRELAKNNPEAEVSSLIGKTLEQMIRPCCLTTITTIAAFASLTMSNVRPVIDFGLMMSIGVIIALLISFIAFPVLMALLPKPKVKNHIDKFPIVQKLAIITDKFGKQIIVALIFLVIVSLSGITKLSVENSFIDYFKKSTEINQGLNFIDQELGGTIPLEIVFDDLASAYWTDVDLREDIHQVHQYLDSIDSVGKVLSIDTFMQILIESNNGKAPNGFILMMAKNQMPESAKSQILRPYISDKNDQLRFVARIKETYPTLNRNKLINDINIKLVEKFDFKPENFHFTGSFALYNNLLQSLFDSQIKNIATVFVIIFVMFLLIFRSTIVALLAVIPNTIPSILILGTMGLANIPLDLMTITIAAIAIGIGIDNAIHYINRFQVEFAKDSNYLASMHRTHSSIGLAIFYTAITVSIGFLVLVLSNFIPSIYFGVFMAIAMLSAVLVNLTLLPKLLIIFKPKINH